VPIDDGVQGQLRFGDSSGVDSGTSDYTWGNIVRQTDKTTFNSVFDVADGQIDILGDGVAWNMGNAAGEGSGGLWFLHNPGDGVVNPMLTGHGMGFDQSDVASGVITWGSRVAVITLDRVQFLFSAGNVETGRMTVWGIAHA